MTRARTLRVADVARITGLSVRALHHYDEIGLVSPGRSTAGYRLYDDGDLLRLQQVLINRELGLSLEEIRRSLDDPAFDPAAALRRQREQLAQRLDRAREMIAAIDAALGALKHDQKRTDPMTRDAMFKGFDNPEYAKEAETRWGKTDAWAESRRRTGRYGKADWEAIKAEEALIWRDAAAAKIAGEPSDSPAARAVAERHRLHIDRWFYPCDAQMHARLADLWESDERFSQSIDSHAEGLTPWLAAAVRGAG